MFRNGRADNVPDVVVAEHPVAAAAARDGVVTPPVQHLAAHTARRVVVPQSHAQTALESDPEEGEGTWESAHAMFADDGASAGKGRQRCLTRTGPRSY